MFASTPLNMSDTSETFYCQIPKKTLIATGVSNDARLIFLLLNEVTFFLSMWKYEYQPL